MGKKDKGICPQMAAMEEDKKWETRGDMDALMRITEVKKDPERKKRLIKHIQDQQKDLNEYDEKYLSSIGLK